jgi:cysteine-rich repeat protein
MTRGMLRLLALATILPALLSACEESSKVVVSVETAVILPEVSHIRVYLSNGDATDQLDFPNEDLPEAIRFPTSLAIIVPHARAGRVDIAIEALDHAANVVGHGVTTASLHPGGRTDSSSVLMAGPSTCGDGRADPPEECDDHNHFSNDDCDFVCTVVRRDAGAVDAQSSDQADPAGDASTD